MSQDYLKNYSIDQVAAWYGRSANVWEKNMSDLHPALAGAFLRTWLTNRVKYKKIEFEAPAHLKSHSSIFEVQAFHRDVFLSNKKARFSGGVEKWAGILPRIQGVLGFKKWDMRDILTLEYESLSDIAPNLLAIAKIQKFGSNADRDIFGSLRGFQLKSKVTVSAQQLASKSQVKISFNTWACSGTDVYDWNYSEYLTVVNPDYGSKIPGAIRPEDQTLTVFHTNAKRLEDAGQAAPFEVILKPWMVFDARLTSSATLDITRSL